MKASVVWSERARRDLAAVLSYVGERSPQAARRLLALFERRAGRLAGFPSSGRLVPELEDDGPAVRELLISRYRLVYELRGRRVEVLTV
ncbi:MAG: type II toxin-antitoxin system RelE/ParE family toxin, partial [Elusimicrobia bacterium]|nr:type II toxin-antitoxin system RelE/ParE family toxin [Elusimicrobiota bacterium]